MEISTFYFYFLLEQILGATFYFLESRKFLNYFYSAERSSHLLLTILITLRLIFLTNLNSVTDKYQLKLM